MNQRHVRRIALAVTKFVGSPLSIALHSLIFVACFIAAAFNLLEWNTMLLFLTTIVSLEAIYLSIFIQMTINYTTESIEGVEENLEELQEDVEEIQVDVGEMQEDVGEIKEDVDELQEDVEEMSEEEESEEATEERRKAEQKVTLDAIQTHLRQLLDDVEKLKGSKQ